MGDLQAKTLVGKFDKGSFTFLKFDSKLVFGLKECPEKNVCKYE